MSNRLESKIEYEQLPAGGAMTRRQGRWLIVLLIINTMLLAVGVVGPQIGPTVRKGIDDFFARHIERVDPYDDVAVALVPRYRVLRETIRHAVREPVVFRVGRIAIDCYVVGTDWEGNVVGLTTVAIET